MRGVPRSIQTFADVQNLFTMARDGKLDKATVVSRFRTLLARQYHSVPILSIDGAQVKTRYFPECVKGGMTACGLSVKAVTHNEDPESEGENVSYNETVVTLSKAPADSQVLSIFLEENYLARNGFNIAKINEYLEVLENA